ncbi:MAG: ScpA family protein [Candidatus Diapherotrites archaeon]|nr:ScpA family protein [Candidatus Diapherotrites archaeon]
MVKRKLAKKEKRGSRTAKENAIASTKESRMARASRNDSVEVENAAASGEEETFERDYSQMDLVDLIDQPAWKTILIDLVRTEKMDPWDIDVAELAEKYLKKINELEQSNLRVPANAILACAILLKTKSKYLHLGPIEDEEDEKPLSEQQRTLMLGEIPDLMANRAFREGKVTLDELVASIEGIINSSRAGRNAARQIPRIELNFDTSTIEERVSEILEKIRQKADSQGVVMFRNLLGGSDASTIVDTFVPVLFLVNSGKIIAYQEEFFGDIFIQLIPESEWRKK